MMKILLSFISIFTITFIHAQSINEREFNNKIFELNNKQQFTESFKEIHKVINNPNSSNYDKYIANLDKCLTYKRVFNYPEALKSLEQALEYGEKTKFRKNAEIRILIEKLLIYFDQAKQAEYQKLLTQVNTDDLKLLDPTTKAFYNIVITDIYIKEKQTDKALETISQTIKNLERYEPNHLSLAYIKLSDIYRDNNQFDKQLVALENADYYAEKSKIDIYKIGTTYALAQFHTLRENHKKANELLLENIKVSQKYNYINKNFELLNFEKNLEEQKQELKNRLDKNIRNFFIAISIILLFLIITLFKLYQTKKKHHKLAEKENLINRKLLKNYLLEEGAENINNGEIIENTALTNRHKEIIELVKQGKTNKEIGAVLFISENTVKYHLKTIYNILGIENRNNLF